MFALDRLFAGLHYVLPVGLTCVLCTLPAAGADDPKVAASTEQSSDQNIAATAEDFAWFEQHVRPLLISRCYECHSEDAGATKGDLSLQHRSGWLDGGESGPAIVPGKPDESLLIQAVRYESYEMPPKGKLSAHEIKILEEWVRRGAPDPRVTDVKPARSATAQMDMEKEREFWAFRQPVSHHPPQVLNSAWPQDAIDFFVLGKLESEQLDPAPDADPSRWLRRITYDLTGLAPTPEERSAFLAMPDCQDTRGEARQQVVDRLLASPQFGVHWGRHWLDVARYADSNGGDFNATFFNAWRYRNYVVDSFNTDKPYDQFVREQIAGDLLPADTETQRNEQLIASTFLMLGVKMLSERDKNKLTMDVVDEQIDTTGKAFLGMTLGCARCHDHKFDPIPTQDYYSLAGIFRSTVTLEGESQEYVSTWVETPLPMSDEVARQIEEHAANVRQKKAELEASKSELKKVEQLLAKGGGSSGAILLDNDVAKVVGEWPKSSLSPVRVGDTYLRDDQVGKGMKSVTWTPTIMKAGKYEVQVSYPGKGGCSNQVPYTVRFAGGEKRVLVDQSQPGPIDGLFCSLGVFEFLAGADASVTVSNEDTVGHVLADAVQWIPQGEIALAQSDDEAAQQIAMLQKQVKDLKESIKKQDTEIKTAEKNAPKKPSIMAPREAKQIDDCEIFVRGEIQHPGPKVERGFLQVLSSEKLRIDQKKESGRRELADWLTRNDNPLTARVMVNRIWQHLLGEGIVRSVDNFGHLGESPSHEELLDTLAVEFMNNGWSMKSLIRRIALSRTYAINTDYREDAFLKDPDNRLLWRANRKRLTAESLRDSLLQISGDLDLEPGESPVAGLSALAIDNSSQGSSGQKTDVAKRSLYLPIVRNELPSFLVTFDFADPDIVTGRRPETNVPAQAMYLMNNAFVKARASALAAQLLNPESSASAADGTETTPGDESEKSESAEVQDDSSVCVSAFERIFSRAPTSAEITKLVDYVSAATASGQVSREAAWTEILQALFASTEFRMLE
jgi:hypothetical protein